MFKRLEQLKLTILSQHDYDQVDQGLIHFSSLFSYMCRDFINAPGKYILGKCILSHSQLVLKPRVGPVKLLLSVNLRWTLHALFI